MAEDQRQRLKGKRGEKESPTREIGRKEGGRRYQKKGTGRQATWSRVRASSGGGIRFKKEGRTAI